MRFVLFYTQSWPRVKVLILNVVLVTFQKFYLALQLLEL